jgi:hypothetical protein
MCHSAKYNKLVIIVIMERKRIRNDDDRPGIGAPGHLFKSALVAT